jgi:succinate-semialdehyde dehydrogenase / glutarate-semialdehyde dehydrogenase
MVYIHQGIQQINIRLPRCGVQEVRHAINAAHEAFILWRASTAKLRGEVLRRWFELVNEHRDDLTTLITLEEDKPLAEACGEVDYAASFLRWVPRLPALAGDAARSLLPWLADEL